MFDQEKLITQASVEACRASGGPRRVAFAYTHRDQPKRSKPPYIGSFSVPFANTIKPIFEEDTGLSLFKSQYGFWRSILSEFEFDKIADWVKAQQTRIFLRDCLDRSIALDQNLLDNTSAQHTLLGKLEAAAKDEPDDEAIESLTTHFVAAITSIPGYRDAKRLAAVPPRMGKPYDLPSYLAGRISRKLNIEDLTPYFSFCRDKGGIKTLNVAEKWNAWERSGLSFSRTLIDSPPVILIDDKYQSGITIQYVASKLQEAGAGQVLGLCAVKTLRDTDNS